MVSVIFRPHGRRRSLKLRYFPSLSLTQTTYLTQRVKNDGSYRCDTLLQKDDWT